MYNEKVLVKHRRLAFLIIFYLPPSTSIVPKIKKDKLYQALHNHINPYS